MLRGETRKSFANKSKRCATLSLAPTTPGGRLSVTASMFRETELFKFCRGLPPHRGVRLLEDRNQVRHHAPGNYRIGVTVTAFVVSGVP
jgi:hypothetical protein